MKKITLMGALLSAALFAPAVHAADASGVYIAGDIGMSIPRDVNADLDDSVLGAVGFDGDYDKGLLLSAAVGYHVMPNVRGEIELSYNKSDFGDGTALGVPFEGLGDARRLAMMLNGFYDFKNTSKFTPFVGAGLGLARVDIDTTSAADILVDDSDTVFAYQLSAGVGFAMTEQVSLTLGYRYFDTAEGKFDYTSTGPSTGTLEDDFSDHQIRAGVRYSF